MQEINLLQSKIKDREEQWQKNNRTANIVLFLILILILGIGGMFWYLDSGSADKLVDLNSQTVRLQSEIDAQNDTLKTATAYQAQLKNLKFVVSNHVAWTTLLQELNEYTLTGITYESLQGLLGEKIHVEGQTTNYNQLAKLILGLDMSENIEDVDLLSTSVAQEQETFVTFSLDLTVAPNLFKPQ